MERIEWSDQIGPRERRAWLLLVANGRIHRFVGGNIPGIVVVAGEDFVKDGKWSHTTYRLSVSDSAHVIAGRDGWETGRFVEGLRAAVRSAEPLDDWAGVANALGVTVAEAKRFLGEWRPRAAERLDETEAALIALDEAESDEGEGEGAEKITISFGSPTGRQRAAGFWEWPIRVLVGHEEVGRVTPVDRVYHAQGRVTLLDVTWGGGYHGGSCSLTLAVPAGAEAVHGPEPAPEPAAIARGGDEAPMPTLGSLLAKKGGGA